MRKLVTGLVAAAVLAVTAIAIPQAAHAWGEAEYTGAGQPRFNTYTNVPGLGDEHDFVRIGKNGNPTSSFNNNLEACDGEARVSVYIHNGAPEVYNGSNNDGTGVAKDAKLQITVPKTSAEPFAATVSASNAPSVSDTAKITCNGEAVELEYVPNTAEIFGQQRDRTVNNALVSGSPVTIGTASDNGVIPGCWDFRVYVTYVVKIKKVQKQPTLTCDKLDVITTGDNKYKFTAHATATNTSITKYVFDFGDGKTQTVESAANSVTSAEHQFTKSSKVTVSVSAKDITQPVTGTNCAVQINMNQPPVTPPTVPTTIAQTGPASTLATFGAISALAYGFRRWLDSRKAGARA